MMILSLVVNKPTVVVGIKMYIKNRKNLKEEDILNEIEKGSRLIVYSYCISIIRCSNLKYSKTYLVNNNFKRFVYGIPHSLMSLLFGWWSLPRGPFQTIAAVIDNTTGGEDVTSKRVTLLKSAVKGEIDEIDVYIKSLEV